MGRYIDLNRNEKELYGVQQGQGYLHFKVHCSVNNGCKYIQKKSFCKEKQGKISFEVTIEYALSFQIGKDQQNMFH